MSDWLIIFSMGLLGGAHCIGMCGGFALIAAGASERALHRVGLYLGGKTLTYVILGFVLGLLGGSLMGFGAWQRALSIAVGVFLVLLGLATAKVIPDRFFGVPTGVSRALGRLMGRSQSSGPFVLGLVNGLIPCGLVYGALAQASTLGSGLAGALGMALFGIGTVPALLLAAVAGQRVGMATRARVARLGGWLVVAFGVWVIVRTLIRGAHAMA